MIIVNYLSLACTSMSSGAIECPSCLASVRVGLRWFGDHTLGWYPSPLHCVGSVKALYRRSGQPNLAAFDCRKPYQLWRRVTNSKRREYVMLVFVLNKHGEPLMPCKPRKARLLVKEGKAKIINYQPFAIQLVYGSSGYKQPVAVGVSFRMKQVGLAVASEEKVLLKGELELRTDVKSLLEKRKAFRRSRRIRRTRYREARYLNRRKPKGWLPPSLESRIANVCNWIDRICRMLPTTSMQIEVGKFHYRQLVERERAVEAGARETSLHYYDSRYFVFARDRYICQICKRKNKILNTHHIVYKGYGGSDHPANLLTVCVDCHTADNHLHGRVFWRWMEKRKQAPIYKENPFMNSMRIRISQRCPDAAITYGSLTTIHRKRLGLEKSIVNDAIANTGNPVIYEITESNFYIKQFRKKKRSLHEATARKGRKKPNTESRRNAKNTKASGGFFLNDEVETPDGSIGYISGFSGKNACYVKSIEGEYIVLPGKKHKQQLLKGLRRHSHQGNWQVQVKNVAVPKEIVRQELSYT